jgi:ApbE superfamily uncharacterized protein (UPF0280 family)
LVAGSDLVRFNLSIEETDLAISAERDLKKEAVGFTRRYRREIKEYLAGHPAFGESFEPVDVESGSPALIRAMAQAAKRAGVGPMASVAGAVAEFVGRELLGFTRELIVENGGDIFIKSQRQRNVGIFAGKSKFSQRITLKVLAKDTPCGICTSSGTVGHSFSFGKADAVVVAAESAVLADAFATAIGNVVKSESDIEKGLGLARGEPGIRGAVIIVDERMGLCGDIQLTPLPLRN